MQGVYLITNLVNNKKYVGMSNDITRRFAEHKTPKNIRNKKTNLAKAFRKYSIDNFSFDILELVDSIDDLMAREMHWIATLQPEYNMNEGGEGNRGHFLSDEMKEVLSAKAKKQWANMPEETKVKLKSNLQLPKVGHPVLQKTRMKLRAANIGKRQSAETKKKRSDANKVSLLGNTNGSKAVMAIFNTGENKIFPSARVAASEFGITPPNITSVIKGRQKTAGGCKWVYAA